MKKVLITAITACAAGSAAHAATLFQADFNVAEDISNTDAQMLTLMNSGTSVGTWDSHSNTVTSQGVQQNATADNGALYFDSVNSYSSTASFSSGADFSTDSLTFSLDLYPIRGGSAKKHYINFYDSTTLVYGVEIVSSNGQLWYRDTIDGSNYSANIVVINPAPVLTIRGAGEYDPAELDALDVVFTGTSVTLNGTASGRTLASSEIDSFDFDATGNAGLVIDNMLVTGTPVPEPGSLALLGLGGMLIARRRRGV